MNMAINQRIFKEGIIVFPEDASQKPYLTASKCPQCGKVFFPKNDFCPQCMLDNIPEIALGDEVSLYAYTTVYVGVKGFKTPYVLGWVEFPEEKIRLASQILVDPDKASELLRTGQKLKLNIGVLRTLEDGTEIVGYRYEPVA